MLYTTQKNFGTYKILNKAILNYHKKNFDNNQKNIFYLERKLNLKFIIFYILNSLKFFLFLNEEKFLYLKYRKTYIGRHVVSYVYRDVTSHKSKIRLRYNYLKYFFIAGLIAESANYYVQKASAIYVDHPGYLNGIFFSIFAENKKIVYAHCYPRGLFCINFSKKNNFLNRDLEKCLKFYHKKKNTKKKIIKNYVKRIFVDPEQIPHMRKQNWENLNFDTKKIDYIVYTHSFVDGLMWWGIDGFVNLKDWTEFTIDTLIKKNKNILVKVHPNFFQKVSRDYLKLDKEIFSEIMNKYSNNHKVYFVNEPIKNFELLKNVKKETIIISHHGTALLEGMAFNLKCISSIATLWNNKNFRISNVWNSKKSYKRVLKKNWKNLKFTNKRDFDDIEELIFGNDYNIYGKKYWQNILCKNFKIHLHEFVKDPHKFTNNANKNLINKTAAELSGCIELVNL